jgi:predicted nucleic acid-binding protein
MKTICNTTPFIALSSIGKIELLSRIYSEIIVPEAVTEEINANGQTLNLRKDKIDHSHFEPGLH